MIFVIAAVVCVIVVCVLLWLAQLEVELSLLSWWMLFAPIVVVVAGIITNRFVVTGLAVAVAGNAVSAAVVALACSCSSIHV